MNSYLVGDIIFLRASDAMACALDESIRTNTEQKIIKETITNTQECYRYVYCYIRKGDQA